ncbi:hypothetical protein VNO80_10080 [Phaseolus coccineus]|uniref:Uncharacterized protein n=1 Tax=Phaseolus coccineus TaxID=3886 RepID=A0AAN9RJ41_PHACN
MFEGQEEEHSIRSPYPCVEEQNEARSLKTTTFKRHAVALPSGSAVQAYQIHTRTRAKATTAIHSKEEGLEEETKKKDVATLLTKMNDVCMLDGQSRKGGVPCSEAGRRNSLKAIPFWIQCPISAKQG